MPEMSSVRILVVDDDPWFTKSLGDTLQHEGWVVVTADGGRAGIDAFQAALNGKEPFAIVITDLGMLDVDGRQVAAAVKSVSPFTPVILMTGWGEWFETEDGLPLPVDCVFSKPPKLRELCETLTRLLESAKT